MKILVAYAVDPEFAPWTKLRKFQDLAAGDFTIRRTEIGQASVDFIVTGMGPAHARRAMEAVTAANYDVCLACGFAGGVRSEHAVGEIVAPVTVRDLTGGVSAPCDLALIDAAARNGATRIDVLVSCDRIVTTIVEKARLAQQAAAVDMESYAVLAAAEAAGRAGAAAAATRSVRAAAIRIISDRHDQAMPVDLSTTVDERGQVAIGRVLKMVAGNPGQLSALMRLGRDSKAAAEQLARFLNGYIERLD